MRTEEALAELGIELPYDRKVSCPKHSDSDPSLHLYPEDKGFFCFGCNVGGDGWTLLSHYMDRPVAELMRERGVKLGPRPRSRWEQLDELEARATSARWKYHLKLKQVWAMDKRRGYRGVQTTEDRVDYLYGGNISARYFPEDQAPYVMEQTVHDLESFLKSELVKQQELQLMTVGL